MKTILLLLPPDASAASPFGSPMAPPYRRRLLVAIRVELVVAWRDRYVKRRVIGRRAVRASMRAVSWWFEVAGAWRAVWWMKAAIMAGGLKASRRQHISPSVNVAAVVSDVAAGTSQISASSL
ncbi:hypothetical protein GUJ93_ZPchr0012g21160 [Zizania palustris]|uniref:Uncharacterized protein n=1 Tax=Zizania palustris TaxID=103762 RepID=A0A8J5WNK4_ZIZPA|nr:hypothetical protein GUJ93_ZPchr0012g21160 [Zizania palustris]